MAETNIADPASFRNTIGRVAGNGQSFLFPGALSSAAAGNKQSSSNACISIAPGQPAIFRLVSRNAEAGEAGIHFRRQPLLQKPADRLIEKPACLFTGDSGSIDFSQNSDDAGNAMGHP